MPVDHNRGGGEDGAVGERADLGEAAALVSEDPVELGDALLVDPILQILGMNSALSWYFISSIEISKFKYSYQNLDQNITQNLSLNSHYAVVHQ